MFRALGTEVYGAVVFSSDADRAKAREVLVTFESQCRGYEKVFSRFDAGSELSRLNVNVGKWQPARPDMRRIVSDALGFYRESDGLFDPRVIEVLEAIGYARDFYSTNFSQVNAVSKRVEFPDLAGELGVSEGSVRFGRRMDFSGIAKGYIVDRLADGFRKAGYANFLVDAGGDMYTSGSDVTGNPWKIGVEGVDDGQLLFSLTGVALATSGVSRRQWSAGGDKGMKRYHHLVHPKHPTTFSFALSSVTALAETAERADFLAKWLFLLGEERGIPFAEKSDIPCLFFPLIGDITASSELRKYMVG